MKLYPISMVGGVIGIVSLALPWVAITYTLMGISVTVSGSGFEVFSLASLLGMLGSLGSVGGALSGAILLMTVGVILALVGAIVSFLHYAGGAVTLAGGACGLAGGVWLGSVFSSLGGGTIGFAMGPGFGVFITIVAGIIAIVGIVKPIPLPTAGQPRPYGSPYYPSAGYPGQQPYAGYPPYASQYPGYTTPPPPSPTAPATPPAPEAAPAEAAAQPVAPDATPMPPASSEPAAAAAPVASLRTCPTCGRQSATQFCPEDGTALTGP